jgi:hypothetical protein
MRNLFWPTRIKPEPGVLARIGRAIHWLGTGYLSVSAAWSLVILGVLGFHIATTPPARPTVLDVIGGGVPRPAAPDPADFMLGNAIALLVIALAVYFATRLLRYILAGE